MAMFMAHRAGLFPDQRPNDEELVFGGAVEFDCGTALRARPLGFGCHTDGYRTIRNDRKWVGNDEPR